jgi:hypothetical protein
MRRREEVSTIGKPDFPFSVASDTKGIGKVILTNDEQYYNNLVAGGALILFHPVLAEGIGSVQSALDQVYLIGIPSAIPASQDQMERRRATCHKSGSEPDYQAGRCGKRTQELWLSAKRM